MFHDREIAVVLIRSSGGTKTQPALSSYECHRTKNIFTVIVTRLCENLGMTFSTSRDYRLKVAIKAAEKKREKAREKTDRCAASRKSAKIKKIAKRE